MADTDVTTFSQLQAALETAKAYIDAGDADTAEALQAQISELVDALGTDEIDTAFTGDSTDSE